MVNMGQADSSLRRKPHSVQHVMCWTRALQKAAQQMGHSHYMDVPDGQNEILRTTARKIQIAG